MARKKHRRDSLPNLEFISKETWHTITGVVSIVVAIFLLLSALGLSGKAGTLGFSSLSHLFGIGYYILPIAFIILAVSFLQDQERDMTWPQVLGSAIFFISLLGFVDLVTGRGGGVGSIISGPLISFFDSYLTGIILLALSIISVLVIFDIPLKLNLSRFIKSIFSRRDQEFNYDDSDVNEAVEDLEEEDEEDTNEKEDTNNDQDTRSKKQTNTGADGFAPMIIRRSGKKWVPPPISLLANDKGKPGVGDIKGNANLIKRTLMNFGIAVEMDEISIGPSVTRYALKPAEGVRLSKILGLQNNLELALAAHPVRIEAPIPGKSLVGVEVPNTMKSTIGLGSLVSDPGYTRNEKPLLVALGRDISGNSHFANLDKMPHLLIAGATGSGKSVTIHAIINSLLFRNPPDNLKFIMIDPKRVELTMYNGIPHLLTPVITDPKKAILSLKWTAKEMERRYDILQNSSSRDIDSYHDQIENVKIKNQNVDGENLADPMPYIVVIIDELADLMTAYPRELESAIVRLAQMSRAVGIHLILSTQRPSVNIITGLIKANIPARIALQVASQIDSRTILDAAGAEKLLGAGDMLYLSGEMSKPVRIQSAFISEKEVKEVAKYLKDEYRDELQSEINLTGNDMAPDNGSIFSSNFDNEEEDDLYEEAKETVVQAGKASTSFLQRKLRIGYARAARLIDILEEKGVVGPGSGAKPREVLDQDGEALEDRMREDDYESPDKYSEEG